jgi:hypothetical protein
LKLVENADDQAAADPSLLRILARAHHIQARLSQNPKLTVHGIAREAFCKFPRAPLTSRAIFGFAWRRLPAPSPKKVNHEMAPERFSRRRRPKSSLKPSLVQIALQRRISNPRKFVGK